MQININNKNIVVSALSLCLVLFLFAGCGESDKNGSSNGSQSQKEVLTNQSVSKKEQGDSKAKSNTLKGANLLKGDDIIIAEINNEKISEYDLSLEIATTLGKVNRSSINEETEEKLLKMIVTRKAIASKRQSQLSEAEKKVLDKQVQAYRENLLVKQYLAKSTQNKQITAEMISDFYEKNKSLYGGGVAKKYEMIGGVREINTVIRDNLIKALDGYKTKSDWKKLTNELVEKGFSVGYKSGISNDKLIHKSLSQVIQNLDVNQTSELTFIEGKPFVVRVLSKQVVPPKPLEEVKGNIKKALELKGYKESIKEVSEKLVNESKVIYHPRNKEGS